MTNPHLQRAWMLLDQSRHQLAEQELQQALVQQPDNAQAHAMLALCLSEREALAEATREAQEAIHLAPDSSFPHYVLSHVLFDRNRYAEAAQAVDEAIRLDPLQPSFFAQLARIRLAQRRWQDALDAAHQGLQIDPEDTACTNLRTMALVKLGRKTEAGDAIHAALARQPEDALTHANRGWTLLEQGRHEAAMHHFGEALRIDPTLDWARQGIVEALKARHFLYRLMLYYFLWTTKLSRLASWGLVLGGYFGCRLLVSIGRHHPDLAPWVMPLIILYAVFAVMTWVSSPLFDLLLRLNRFGRLTLSREQIATSNWVGACVLGALLSLVPAFTVGSPAALMSALACGLLIPPLSSIYRCQEGWPRATMLLITLALAGMGLGSVLLVCLSAVAGDAAALLRGLGRLLFLLFILSSLGSQFAAIALASAAPRR